VLHIEAKSFQNLPLQFRVTTNDAVARDTFSVDLDSGSVTLRRTLSYSVDQHQYRFNLSVTERYSNFVSSVPVTLSVLLLTGTAVFVAVFIAFVHGQIVHLYYLLMSECSNIFSTSIVNGI